MPITIYIDTTIIVGLVAGVGFVGRSWACGVVTLRLLHGARVELARARPLIGGVRSLRGAQA